MRLPNALWRRISPDKVTNYLLNPFHPGGAAKARFFHAHGFIGAESDTLMAALFDHPIRNEVAEVIPGAFGTKYVVRCVMETPDQRNPCVCTVWIMEADGAPRLVTAYPG